MDKEKSEKLISLLAEWREEMDKQSNRWYDEKSCLLYHHCISAAKTAVEALRMLAFQRTHPNLF